jgi:hypothetical protein
MRHLHSARWLMPALLLSAVSPFTYAGALPAVPVALRIFPAMAQPQAGKDASAAAQAPTGENPPAKKHRFTLNVNGIQVGVGSTTKKQTTTTAKPAIGQPPAAAPTTTGTTTPPQGQLSNPQVGWTAGIIGGVATQDRVEGGSQGTGATPIGTNSQPPSKGQPQKVVRGNIFGDAGALANSVRGVPAGGPPLWNGEAKAPILFKWTPVIPVPTGLAKYRVSVWQLMQGQTGPQAMKANQPIITKDVDNFGMTQAAWPPDFVIASCKPPNLCSYVWSVQALDRKGRPVGVNGGIVSLAAFRYEPGATATRGTPLIVVDGNQPAAQGIFDRWGELYAEAGAPAMNGAHVTATNTATGVRLATSGQQQKPQPQDSNATARIKGTVTDPQGGDARVTATANPQSAGDRTYIGNPEPKFENGAPVGSTPAPNDNPITAINITLPSNPDANTANWGTGTSQFAIETVGPPTDARGMGRFYGGVNNSRILVIVKQNGNLVCGGQTPFGVVQGGFAPVSKVWSGGNAASLLGKNCTLPPGDYELDTQVVGAQGGTDVALSELVTKPFTIKGNDQQAYQPPQGIDPATGTSFREADAHKPIALFRWTPVIPKPEGQVTYRLSVWQLMQGQTGAQAMKANQPIITKDVDNITELEVRNLTAAGGGPQNACGFIWNVQALDRKGRAIKGYNDSRRVGAFRVDAQSGGLLDQQPGGGSGGAQPRFAAGTYTSCCGLAVSEVDSGGIYDRWGSPALAQKPMPGGSGTGAPAQIDLGIASGGVHRQVTPGAAMKANTPIITKDVDNLQQADAAGMRPRENGGVVGYGTQKRSANGVIIVTTKKGVGGKPAAVDLEGGQLKQNPGYVRVGENPATGTNVNPQTRSDAIKGNAPILEGSDLHVRKSSGTPPIEYMKANTPIITKDVDEQPAASGSGSATRSLAAPGSGSGKPLPADNPITAINITLPANPDANVKVNGTTGGGTGKAQGYMAGVENAHIQADKQAPNQNGKAARQTGSQPNTNTRSLAAPGSGSGKPQPADNPITAINITLPANPDANVKVNGATVSSGTASSMNRSKDVEIHEKQSPEDSATTQPGNPGAIEQTLNQNGRAAQVFTVTNTGGVATGALDTRPPKAQPPGQERDIINKGLPITNKNIVRTEPNTVKDATDRGPVNQLNAPAPLNQNGQAGSQPQTRGMPVASRPESRTVTTDKLQGPEGAGMQASSTPPATAAPPAKPAPQAKPAKKKSKMSVHVTF